MPSLIRLHEHEKTPTPLSLGRQLAISITFHERKSTIQIRTTNLEWGQMKVFQENFLRLQSSLQKKKKLLVTVTKFCEEYYYFDTLHCRKR